MFAHLRKTLPAVLAATLLCFTTGAQAQGVAQFYKGRNVTLIIPSAPGGVNDLAGRLVAQFLGKYIPGNPTVIPQNLPGSSGVVAANRIYNSAEKDGSVISIIERGAPQVAILGDPNAKYDPTRFTWLGSVSSYADDAYLMLVNSSSPVQSVADLKKPGVSITLGAMNPGTTNLTFPLLAKEVLGLNINVVRGYTGAAPIFLAMQTGELDGQVIGLSSLKAGQPKLWDEHKVRPLIQFGRATRLAAAPDAPTGRELVPDAEALALLEFAEQPFFIALPFMAPPEVPKDRAEALQAAFMKVMADPEFIAGAKRLNLDLSPIDGETVRKMIVMAAQTPKAVIARYVQIVSH
jgi:tripartite-type tricarboxylate transporter receptor subunit TctC